MPIGLVSNDELEKELANLNVVPSSSLRSPKPQTRTVDKPTRGRNEGDVNIPDSLRQIIGEESVINGRQSALQLASEFGISPSSVSAYANGATSTTTYDTPKSSIIQHINKSRMRVVKRAGKKLNAALEALTQEKLDYADAKDLSGIAKDMSVIIKNMEPPQQAADDTGAKQPQFVIFAPTFRDERSFETIKVKE
jgi:hypothetical protein